MTEKSTDGGSGPPTEDEQLPLPMEPSELQDKAISGGVPKDGIPSIDDPSFVSADEASTWLDPGEPVLGLKKREVVTAYPQAILVWHEICNDVVDGTPVSITYCPLTGTAMGFERGDTTFGVSGRLVNNNLILYDRATETWWPQILATSIPGDWNESPSSRSLKEFRLIWTTWERWSNTHSNTQVLSRETGFAKNYDRDPYGGYNPRSGYYSSETSPMFSPLSEDDRLQPKTVVLGTRTSNGTAAFKKRTLATKKLIHGDLGGEPVLATYDSDLDTGYIFKNPDQEQFSYRDGMVMDETGETFAPDSLPLDGILGFDAMWFAWIGFYPDTSLHV
jgi:hypothetical protein